MYKSTAALFAAVVAALPTFESTPISCTGGFKTYMTTSNGVLFLDAVANGTNTNLIVIGQPPPIPGGTVMLTGTSPAASLSFEIDGSSYGWVVGNAVRLIRLQESHSSD